MATTTQAITATNTDWTLIADGATVANIGIQIDPTTPSAYLAFATSKPVITSNDYIVLQRERDTSVGPLDISATDKVYVRAPGGAAVTVRAVLSGR